MIKSGTYLENFMELAIEEARLSLKNGEKGFGAVIIKGNEIIAMAHDSETADNDPTSHAEIQAIRKACRKLGRDLSECMIITTHEPCPMCSAAMVWANITKLAYGASIKDTLKEGRKRIKISVSSVYRKARKKLIVHKGILRDECMKLYNAKIRNFVEMFNGMDKKTMKKIEHDLTRSRLEWFENNRKAIERIKGNDLERAYYLLLKKLGLKHRDAQIVDRSDNRLVFHSKNPCPSLEACRILGFNTKTVCSEIYERPTEALIQKINPNLRFTRNYEKIRPFMDYCEEIIYFKD